MLELNATEKAIVDALKVHYIARNSEDAAEGWLGVYLFKDEPDKTADRRSWISSTEFPTYLENKDLFNCIEFGECYKILEDGSLDFVSQLISWKASGFDFYD